MSRTTNQTPSRPTAPPGPLHPQPSEGLKKPPTEPAEVLGRHKNSGQKDHKGAR